MAVRRALIHRYDNRPDILAVESRGYSDVYTRATCDDFDLVVVVPTGRANTNISVYGTAMSRQYQPDGGEPWPGRPDRYPVRVDVSDVRYTTRDAVREAVLQSGKTWAAQWTVLVADLDEELLKATPLYSTIHEHTVDYDVLMPGEKDICKEKEYVEGAAKQVVFNAYERNAAARKACIDAFGATCVICGFDFEKEYGKVGRGFIHVHHLVPLHEIGEEYKVDPLNDLRPVCPNCHAIIHIKSPPYTIHEVQQMMDRHKRR